MHNRILLQTASNLKQNYGVILNKKSKSQGVGDIRNTPIPIPITIPMAIHRRSYATTFLKVALTVLSHTLFFLLVSSATSIHLTPFIKKVSSRRFMIKFLKSETIMQWA